MAARIAPKRLLPVAAAAAACLAVPLAAQPDPPPAPDPAADGRGWSAGLWMGYGHQWPIGRLATNEPSDVPGLALLQVALDVDPSPMAAGGVEARFPNRGLAVRLGWEGARGAEASGQLVACGLFTGPLCQPVTAPARVNTYSAVARLLAGNADRAVRPVLSGGFGVRTFDFDPPDCPRLPTDDIALICSAVRDLYLDPGPQFLLRAGAGVQVGAGRIAVAADAYATTGQYRGGAGRTDGNWHHDLRAELSLGVALY